MFALINYSSKNSRLYAPFFFVAKLLQIMGKDELGTVYDRNSICIISNIHGENRERSTVARLLHVQLHKCKQEVRLRFKQGSLGTTNH